MSFVNLKSIRKNLALLVLLTLMPAVAILFYSGIEQRQSAIEHTQQDVLVMTQAMTQVQKDMTRSAREILSTLALMPDVQSLDIQTIIPIFKSLLNQNPNYVNITLADLSGTVLASAIPYSKGNLSDRKHFRDALKTKNFSTGEFIVTRVGNEVAAFPFAYPVLDATGSPKGVLTIAINLTLFTKLYSHDYFPPNSFVAITDHQGIRLFYYPEKKATNPIGTAIKASNWEIASQAQEPGIITTSSSDGTTRIAAFNQIRLNAKSDPYMYVWAGVPESLILAQANTILLRNIAIMLLTTLGVLYISWCFGRKTFITPINELISITNRFATGDLDFRIEKAERIDEFRKLIDSFHGMAESLSISQKKLQRSEDQAKKLSEVTFEGIVIHNNAIVEDVNESLTKMFGYTREELIGINLIELLFPIESHSILLENITKEIATPYEVIARKKSGLLFPAEIESRNVNKENDQFRVSAIRDITDRKEAENLLNDSRERYKALHDASFGGVILHDQGLILDCNRALSEITGFSHDELIGMDGLKLIAPDSLNVVLQHIKTRYDQSYEVKGVRKDGSTYPLAIRGKNIHYQGHEVRVIEFRDITDLKKSELLLKKSEKKLQLVFEYAPVGLFQEDFSAVKDRIEQLKHEGVKDFKIYLEKNPEVVAECASMIKIIDVNRTALKLHHAETKEDFFTDLSKTFTDESYQAFRAELTALAHGADSFHTETTIQTLNGERKEVLLQLFIDPSHDNWSCTYVSLTDITERKRAEEKRRELEIQVRQKYKMEAIGVMAGGMAHNFNNNLSIILGNLELAKIKLAQHSDIGEFLVNIKTAVLRSRDLVNQIMTYSRKDVQPDSSLQLSLLLKETITLLKSTIPSSVKLSLKIDPDCDQAYIVANASQVQECLLNLSNNAVHAMNEKGDLILTLERTELNERDISPRYNCQPGPYLCLSVQDNGSGIPPKQLDKIFDPFYTTKELHQGTGMGLATVQGIMQQHNGLISVESQFGETTIFHLYFPLINQEKEKEKEMALQKIELQRGTEKILCVDDDEMVTKLNEKMLSEMGYRVTGMTDSTEALKLFTANADHFDLVMTDQTMPELTGSELIDKIKKLRPEIPTILCTGYSSKVNEEDAYKAGVNAFLMKPVEFQELLDVIRNVLDEQSAR